MVNAAFEDTKYIPPSIPNEPS